MEATLPTQETGVQPLSRRSPRRPTARELAFLYLVPALLMALPLGMYRAGLGLPIPLSLALWVSVCLISWWLSEAFSHLFARVLRPWQPPTWSILTLGYLLNLWISSLYNVPIVAALIDIGRVPLTPELAGYFEMERSLVDPAYLVMLLRGGAAGLVVWLTVNLLFNRLTGTDRLSDGAQQSQTQHATAPVPASATASTRAEPVVQPVAATPANPPPRFFERLQKLKGLKADELLAVQAEDHYVRVHSRRGQELIYYRFRDALDELRAWDGMQAHRSVWIRRSSIVNVEESGRSTWAILESGDRLPVSFANRALVRASMSPS